VGCRGLLRQRKAGGLVHASGIERMEAVRDVAEAREQMRTLLGEIKLVSTAEGHLEAELIGRYKGLIKLPIERS
jgi:hypothetical protein